MKTTIYLIVIFILVTSCTYKFDAKVIDIKYFDEEHIHLIVGESKREQQEGEGYLVVKVELESSVKFHANGGLYVRVDSKYCTSVDVEFTSSLFEAGGFNVPNDLEIENSNNHYYYVIDIINYDYKGVSVYNLYDNIDDLCAFINPIQAYSFVKSKSKEFKINRNNIQTTLLNGWIEEENDF